jgi:DNA-binding transcriptional LysR family regulator
VTRGNHFGNLQILKSAFPFDQGVAKMTQLNPFALLLEIEAAGSLTGAATRMRKSISAISKSLSALEHTVGHVLVDRQARPLRFTDAGRSYLEAAARIRDALHDSADRLTQEGEAPRGRLRIATSVLFGHVVLADYVHQFHQRFPQVRIETQLSDDYLDLARADIDLAIRHEQRGGGQWIARPLCDNTAWLCASPDYASRNGLPRTPEDLDQHAMLVYRYPSLDTRWVLSRAETQIVVIPLAQIESDSNDFLLDLALAGDGLLACPSWSAAELVAQGRLVRCLADWQISSESYGDTQLWAVYPASSRGAEKLTQFIDGLRQHVAQRIEMRRL